MNCITLRQMTIDQAFRHATLNDRATSPDTLLRASEPLLIPGASYARYVAKEPADGTVEPAATTGAERRGVRVLTASALGRFGIARDRLETVTLELTERAAERLRPYELREGDVVVALGTAVSEADPLKAVVATAADAGALVPRGFAIIRLDEDARAIFEPIYLASWLGSESGACALSLAIENRSGKKGAAATLADLIVLEIPLTSIEAQRALIPAFEAAREAEQADRQRERVRLNLFERALADEGDGSGLSMAMSEGMPTQESVVGDERFMVAMGQLAAARGGATAAWEGGSAGAYAMAPQEAMAPQNGDPRASDGDGSVPYDGAQQAFGDGRLAAGDGSVPYGADYEGMGTGNGFGFGPGASPWDQGALGT